MVAGQRWTPHAYQKKMVKWLVRHPEAALLVDPGLGKTSCALAAFKALRKANGARKALVVAPIRVCYMVWSHHGELGAWWDFRDLTVSLIHADAPAGGHAHPVISPAATRRARLQADVDIYVVNFEGLPWLIKEGGLDDLVKRGVDVLIIDELSKLKHIKTKRFKLLKKKLGLFSKRWGLTGSPAPNGLLDLFGQVYALDLGKRLGRYITQYRNRWFFSTGYGGYTWVPRPGADEEIHLALKDLAISVRAADHLDGLPTLVERDTWVDLPPDARQVYDTMERDLIASVEKDLLVAANAAVATGKCRQIASGGVYTALGSTELADLRSNSKRRVVHLHHEKTMALVELVNELQGQPLLVAYEFKHDVMRIQELLDVEVIDGSTTPRRTRELLDAWNTGQIPVLCGHVQSLGHGLNLQHGGCHHLCFYSVTWDLELYDQFIRRVWRQGNDAPRVVVHRFLARNTIDVVITKVLRSKRRTQSALLEALKVELKRRKR